MKVQFVVTIEGKWHFNGKPATTSVAEKMLREAVKEEFEYLATRATVSRVPKEKNHDAN